MQIHFYIPIIDPALFALLCLVTFICTIFFAAMNDIEKRHWYGFQILLLGLLWPITLPWHILRFLRWFLFNRH